MSEELENTAREYCICKTKFFKKFLVIALGSFVGVFCALSLFCFTHRPPMHHMMNFPQMFPPVIIQQDGGCKCHKMMKRFHNDKEFKKEFDKMQKEMED